MSSMIQPISSSIALLDTHLNFIFTTQDWLDVYGLKESIVGQNLYHILPSMQSYQEIYQQVLLGHTSAITQEYVIDERPKLLYHKLLPLYKQNRVTGLEISTTPIAQKEDIEHATQPIVDQLQSLQKNFFANYIFEHTHDGIMICDSNNRIIKVNAALEHMSGYQQRELLGSNPKILKSGWREKAFYEEMWDAIIHKGLWQGELVNRKKGGKLFSVDSSISPIRDSSGEIINYISLLTDITEKKHKEERIEKLVYYDFLTNLPNKSLFKEKVETYIKPSSQSKSQFAILLIDIYNFKLINQSIGYEEGDNILLQFSRQLLNIVTKYDAILARFEGDEFAIMLQYQDTLSISYLANEIMELNKVAITSRNIALHIFSNMGISLYPQNSTNYDDLMQYATRALHKSREKGKGRYNYYSEDLNQIARYKLDIDMNLYNAITNNEFYLVYQPKYSIKEHKTLSCEVLIRWKNAQFGNLNPDQFIPIAEESEYIVAIGSWIVKQALEDLVTIQRMVPHFTIAINVSSRQLENDDFINTLQHNMTKHGIDPASIELEITETAIMDDIDKAIEMLQEIKALGVKLAIDDFGTGYSSMSYLKRLPIDTLKIDKEFIKDIHNDHESQAIVNAIISLGKLFNLKSVAEGVETLAHKELLESIGCDILQGFYISRPLLLDDLLYFITK